MTARAVIGTALAAAWVALLVTGASASNASSESPPPPAPLALPAPPPSPSPAQPPSPQTQTSRSVAFLAPSPPPPPPPPRRYARFHANDSLVGRLIKCSRQEKVCFGFNTLYYPEGRRCLRREDAGLFVGSRRLFDGGRGRLVAERLPFRDACRGARMAWDGRCYSRAAARRLCGCDAPLTRHLFGGVECRCDAPQPPAAHDALAAPQPEEEGVCRVPALHLPDFQRRALRGDPSGLLVPLVFLRCSAHQAACFQAGRVAVGGAGGCAALHARGPCPRDHVVALDEEPAARGRRAEGTCVHARGRCPRGQRRLAHDGRCHADAEVELVRPGQLLRTPFGRHVLLGPGVRWQAALSVSTIIELRYHFRVCTVQYSSNRSERAQLPDAPRDAADNKVYGVQDLPPE